jgi:uncharacterized protein YdbL (DUF1318 family)
MLTLACVTVNVYFPAAEVQDAADQIVEEIHGDSSIPSDSSAIPRESLFQRAMKGLPLFERQAYAQADINVTTPNIRALKQSMKERFKSLRPLYENGVIGEANNGLLAIRSLEGLDLKGKAEARKLEKAENKDREELYLEIAEANDIPPNMVSEISRLFANSWRKDAKDGWWIQKDNDEWIRKGSE